MKPIPRLITVSFKDAIPDGYKVVNCTSRGDEYADLSPFKQSNVLTYDGMIAKNVENDWQFSKVYHEHDCNGVPNIGWAKWRNRGFDDSYAHRYPMGKGRTPLYLWWNDIKMDYITARKEVYFPLYIQSMANNECFMRLKQEFDSGLNLAIKDFDVYRFDKLNYTLKDVVSNPNRKAGHGFVLYHLLTGIPYK